MKRLQDKSVKQIENEYRGNMIEKNQIVDTEDRKEKTGISDICLEAQQIVLNGKCWTVVGLKDPSNQHH